MSKQNVIEFTTELVDTSDFTRTATVRGKCFRARHSVVRFSRAVAVQRFRATKRRVRFADGPRALRTGTDFLGHLRKKGFHETCVLICYGGTTRL